MDIIYKDSGQIADISHLDGIVVLYAAAFGNMDSHGDIFMPGAFKKTIQEQGPRGSNRIKMLWMHWWDELLGVPLELEEDDVGLRVVSKVSKTQLGRDALILYDDGVITEHSVGISAVIREEDEVGNTAQIKEARLWEYSPVTWGANPLTPTVDVKSALGREASATIPTPLEVQIKNAGRALHTSNISDELGRKIESWLKLAKGEATPEELGPDAPKLDSSLEELVLLSQSYLVNLTI